MNSSKNEIKKSPAKRGEISCCGCLGPDWSRGPPTTIRPASREINRDYLLMVVAVLGTTISPCLFFRRASQEVEEMKQNSRSAIRKSIPSKCWFGAPCSMALSLFRSWRS
jgi:Mn2+/Fe2+ NRAMP family transporter